MSFCQEHDALGAPIASEILVDTSSNDIDLYEEAHGTFSFLKDQIGYLAGPMTIMGEDFNYPMFNNVARHLRGWGLMLINPAEHYGGDTSLPRSAYLRVDLMSLLSADYLVLLGGWQRSPGANLEVDIALERGIPIFEWSWSRDLVPLPANVKPRPPRVV